MKKFISVLLSLIISISIIPFSERSVFAQDEELVDIDIFKAQCMAGIAEDNHSDAVDQCVNLYNYYVNDNIYSPTQTFLDSLYANDGLMALYETWQIYNLEKTPSAALQQMASKEDYYESLIIGMYQKALVQQSDMRELLNNKILNDSKDMVSTLCEITSAADAAELSGMMALSDPETYTKVTETVESKYPSGIASKIVGNISLMFEAAENVVDALDRISLYASMAELDESSKLWLQQLYDACDSNVPVELKNAVANLKDASMGFADAALVSVKENTFSLSLWAFDSVINAGIQSAAALNPITNAVMIGLTAGKTICNIFFGSDGIYEQLYLMECIYEVQDLSRKVAEGCKNTFINNQTKENAMAFNYAVDCYYESIINIDIDCMKSFLDKLYNGGIDLGSAGGVLDLVISWVYGTPDDYDDAVDSLESLRNTRITNKQNLEAYVWIALMANHPETYNYYFPDKDMVPVTSLSLLVTYILPEGYEHETNKTKIVEGDDATYWVDYSPEEADLTDYTITVSDPEILQVKDGVILALKPGKATVTVTSTADDHVFDTEEIEVIERNNNPNLIPVTDPSCFTYTISKNEVIITGLIEGYIPLTINIPSLIEGYPVTSIQYGAFSKCDYLNNLVIPASVKKIGSQIFFSPTLENLYYLGSVNDWCNIFENEQYEYNVYPNECAEFFYIKGSLKFSDSISEIPSDAFKNCKSLSKIIIPNSVSCIGNYAFGECCNLTNIIIGDGVINIGAYAFTGCDKLVEISIGSNVTTIGYNAFGSCSSLESINIPGNVKYIHDSAFSWCDQLSNINIENGVESIGHEVFCGCVDLNNITIPNSVSYLGENLFIGCYSLENIDVDDKNFFYCSENGILFNKDKTKLVQFPGGKDIENYIIPNSVIEVGSYAFAYCNKLQNITVSDSVTNIGYRAFIYCVSAQTIYISDRVENIGEGYPDTFEGCISLESIIVSPENNFFSSEDGVLFDKNKNTLLKYPDAKIDKEYIVPDSVKKIGATAFLNLAFVGDSIKVGNDLFYIKDTLQCVIIPEGVTSIEKNAFSYRQSLKNILISNSVMEISNDAFSDCKNISILGYEGSFAEEFCRTKNIPFNTLKKLSDSKYGIEVFERQKGLLPQNAQLKIERVNTIKDNVSYNIVIIKDNKELQPNGTVTVKLPMPDGMEGNVCKVYRQESDGSYTDMNAVYQDGYMVFTTDHFSRYVLTESDPNNADITNSDFEYTVLDDGTIAITKYNGNDTILRIPSQIGGCAVTSINGFDSNYSLEEVWIPNSVTSIGNAAFYGCENLKCVVIGNGITEIPESAFRNCFSLEKIVISDSVNSIPRMTFWDAKIDAIIYGYKDSEAEIYQQEEMHAASGFYVLPDITDDGELSLYYSLEETMINEVIFSLYLNLNAESIAVKDSQGNTVTNTEQTILPGMIFDVTLDDGSKLVFSVPDAAIGDSNESEILYGDLNSDGLVNKKDSLLMKMYLADNATVIDMQAADVYADGTINKKDSLYLKQYLAGLDVELGL